MFRPRTQSTCSGLYLSSFVRRCLPTRLPRALSANGRSTLAPVALSPVVAILDAASSISPVFATLTKNTRGGVYSSFSTNHLHSACPDPVRALESTRASATPDPSGTRHHPLTPIPFRIRTSAKCSRNPFRMNTYRKTGEGSLHGGRDDRSLEVGEGGGFGGVVVEEAEEAGDFQGAAEVGAEIREAEARAFGDYFAMGFDQGTEAGAVHIGDVFEIDDDASGASGKKIVNGGAKADALFAERQTTAEGQKIEAIRFALRDFQSHREPSHAPI
jgi:hypothetical protein